MDKVIEIGIDKNMAKLINNLPNGSMLVFQAFTHIIQAPYYRIIQLLKSDLCYSELIPIQITVPKELAEVWEMTSDELKKYITNSINLMLEYTTVGYRLNSAN